MTDNAKVIVFIVVGLVIAWVFTHGKCGKHEWYTCGDDNICGCVQER